MRKQRMTGIVVVMLAILLAACSNSQTKAESTIAEETTEAETTEIQDTTVPEPKLEVSMTEWEIGYGVPVRIQGEIPVSGPEMTEAEATKEAEPETESELVMASDEAQQKESEESSEGEEKPAGTENREPVTIRLSMTDIESCSYEVKTVEQAASWEEEYREEEGTSESKVPEKPVEPGYHFEGEQLVFDRLGQYEIIVLARGTDGQELSETIAVTVIDDVPPVLYVPEEVTWVAGEDWTDFLSECVAEDEIDGDLTHSIVFQDERENPFDPETPGEYLLRFSVRDHSENEAAAITHITVTEKEEASNSSDSSRENTSENQETQRAPETQEPVETPLLTEVSTQAPTKAPTEASTEAPTEAAVPEPEPQPEPGPASESEPEPEPEPPAVTSEYLDGSQIVGLINSARAEAGLGEVSWGDGLLELAKTRANEQSIKTGHERPDGSHTLQYYRMGECTAWGYSSVQDVFDAWMASEGHRAAILWETHTRCCLAGYKDSSGIYWVLLLE